MSNRKRLNKKAQEYEKYLDKLFTMYRDGSFSETMQGTDARSLEWWQNENNPNFNWYQKQDNKSPLMNPWDPNNGILKDPSDAAKGNPDYFNPSYFVDPRDNQPLADEVYKTQEINKINEDPQRWLKENAREANALETVRDRGLTMMGRIFNYSDDADLTLLGVDLGGVESVWDGFTSRLIGGYDLLNVGLAGAVSAAPGGVRTLSYDELSGGYTPLEIFEGAKSAPGNENIAPSTGQIALTSVGIEAARIRNGDGRLADLALLNPATLPFIAAGYLEEDSPLQRKDFDIMNPQDRLEAFSSGPEKFFSGLTDAGLMFADPLIGVGVATKLAKAGALGNFVSDAARAKQATAEDIQMLDMFRAAGDEGRAFADDVETTFRTQDPAQPKGRLEIAMDKAADENNPIDLTLLAQSELIRQSKVNTGWRAPIARFALQVTERGEDGQKLVTDMEIGKRREFKNNPNAQMLVTALGKANDAFTAMVMIRASRGDQAALKALSRIDAMMTDQVRKANLEHAHAVLHAGTQPDDLEALKLFVARQITMQREILARKTRTIDIEDSAQVGLLERESKILSEMQEFRDALDDPQKAANVVFDGMRQTDPEQAKRLVKQLLEQKDAQGRLMSERLAQTRGTYKQLDMAYKTNWFARSVMASRERAARSSAAYAAEGTSIFPKRAQKVGDDGEALFTETGKPIKQWTGWFEESSQGAGRFQRAVRIWRWMGEENPIGYIGLKGTSTVRQEKEVNATLQGLDVYKNNPERAAELKTMLLRAMSDPAQDSYEAIRVFEREVFDDMSRFYGVESKTPEGTDNVRELLALTQRRRDTVIANSLRKDPDDAYSVNEYGDLEYNPWLEVHAANGTFVLNFEELAKAFADVRADSTKATAWQTLGNAGVDAFNRTYETFNNLWRPATLLRASYTQRNVFEGTIRAIAYTHSLKPLIWPAQAAVNWSVNKTGIVARRRERQTKIAKDRLDRLAEQAPGQTQQVTGLTAEAQAISSGIAVARPGNVEPLRVVVQATNDLMDVDEAEQITAGGAFPPSYADQPLDTIPMQAIHDNPKLVTSRPPTPPQIIEELEPLDQSWIDYINEPVEGKVGTPGRGLTSDEKSILGDEVARLTGDGLTPEEAISQILVGSDTIDPRLTTLAQRYIRDTDAMPSVGRGVQVADSQGLVGFGTRTADEIQDFDEQLASEAQYETGTTTRVTSEEELRRQALPAGADEITGLVDEDYEYLTRALDALNTSSQPRTGVTKALRTGQGSLGAKKFDKQNTREAKLLKDARLDPVRVMAIIKSAQKYIKDGQSGAARTTKDMDLQTPRERLTTERVGGRPTRMEADPELLTRDESIAQTSDIRDPSVQEAITQYEKDYRTWLSGQRVLMQEIGKYLNRNVSGHEVQVRVLKQEAQKAADRRAAARGRSREDMPLDRKVVIPDAMDEVSSPGGYVGDYELPPVGTKIVPGSEQSYVTFMYLVMRRQNERSKDLSDESAEFIIGAETDGMNKILTDIAESIGARIRRVEQTPDELANAKAGARSRDWRMRNEGEKPHEMLLFQGRNADGKWSTGVHDAARGAAQVERTLDGVQDTKPTFLLRRNTDGQKVLFEPIEGQRGPIPMAWYRLDGDRIHMANSGTDGRNVGGTQPVLTSGDPTLVPPLSPVTSAAQTTTRKARAEKRMPQEYRAPAAEKPVIASRGTSGGADTDMDYIDVVDGEPVLKSGTNIDDGPRPTDFEKATADQELSSAGPTLSPAKIDEEYEKKFFTKGEYGVESLFVDYGEMVPKAYSPGFTVEVKMPDGTVRVMSDDAAKRRLKEIRKELDGLNTGEIEDWLLTRLNAVEGTAFGKWWNEQIVALRAQVDALGVMRDDLAEVTQFLPDTYGPMYQQIDADYRDSLLQFFAYLTDETNALKEFNQQGKRQRAIGSGVSRNRDGTYYGDAFANPTADINKKLASAEMTVMQKLSLRYDTSHSIWLENLYDQTVARRWTADNHRQVVQGLVRNVETYSASELVQVIMRHMDNEGNVDMDRLVAWVQTPQGQEWYLTSRIMFDPDDATRKDATDLLTSGEKKRKATSDERIDDPAFGIIGTVGSQARGAEIPFIPIDNKNIAIFNEREVRKYLEEAIFPKLDRSFWNLPELRDLLRVTALARARGAERTGAKGGELGVAPDPKVLESQIEAILDSLPASVREFMQGRASAEASQAYPEYMVVRNPRLAGRTPPLDDNNKFPGYTVVSESSITSSNMKVTQMYRRAVQSMFRLIGTMPEDAFVRLPFYNGQYKEARDLMIHRYWAEEFQPTAQQLKLLGGDDFTLATWNDLKRRNANAAIRLIKNSKQEVKIDGVVMGEAGSILIPRKTLATIEVAAHRQALSNTREWMFTIDRRTNLGKYGEYFSPFISATQNSVTVIGKLLARDPWLGPAAIDVYRFPEKMGYVDEDDNILVPKFDLPGSDFAGAMDDNSYIKIARDGLNTLAPPTGYGFVPRLGPAMLIPASEAMKAGFLTVETPPFLYKMMPEEAADQFYEEFQKWLFGEEQTFSDKPFSWDMFLPSTAQKFANNMDQTSAAYGYAYNMARAREMNKWSKGQRETLPSDADLEDIVQKQMLFAAVGAFGLPTPATPYPILTRPQIGTPEEVIPQLLRMYMDADQKAGGNGNPAADFQNNFGYLVSEQGMTSTTKGQGGMAPQVEAVADAKRFSPLIDDIAENINNFGVLGIITNNRTTMGEYDRSARQWQKVNYIPGRSLKWRENLAPEEQVEEAQRINGWISYRRRMDSLDAQLFSLGLRNYQQNGAEGLRAQKDAFIADMEANPIYKGWTKDYQDAGAGKKKDAIAVIRMSVVDPQFRQFMLDSGKSNTLSCMDDYIENRDLMNNYLRSVPNGINHPDNVRLKVAWQSVQDELRMRDLRWAEIFDLYLSSDENPAEMSGLPGVINERMARQ